MQLIFNGTTVVKKKALSFALVISLLCVIGGVVFVTRAMSTTQPIDKRIFHYKHPCIVLKVDNRGCQAEIEMRTRVVMVPRLAR